MMFFCYLHLTNRIIALIINSPLIAPINKCMIQFYVFEAIKQKFKINFNSNTMNQFIQQNIDIDFDRAMSQNIVETLPTTDFDQIKEGPQSIDHEEIVYVIEEESQTESDEFKAQEQHQSDKLSFVDPQPAKGDNKKERFIKYLNHHRESIPISKKQQSNLQDELTSMNNLQINNKRLQEFILKFNKKPAQAIESLLPFITSINSKTQTDNQAKQQNQINNEEKLVAQYLLSIEGIDKNVLGEYFGKNNEKVIKILHEFCHLLDFRNMEFDRALRKLLGKFRLPGESQQIERIIWEFSLSFYQQNKSTFANADQLFPLAYSIIMLATDAHNPKQQKKMTSQQFVKNTQRPCPSIKANYLEQIYHRMTKEKLQTQNNVGEIIYARLRDMQALPKIMDELQNTKQLMQGTVILKICRDNTKLPFTNPRQSKFVQRKVYLSKDQKQINWVSYPIKQGEQPRFIQIKDIIDLTLGIAPHLKKYNKVPKEFDSLCFTITTVYRHLDLKAKNTKQRSQWLNYLRAIMIQRRQNRKIQMEQKENITLSSKALEEVWNGEVFPNWDRYWDYSSKKPKKISYLRRGIDALCGCFERPTNENSQDQIDGANSKLGMKIKGNLLESLWKYGLPQASRKTLWVQIIGNSLQLNKIMIDDIKKRKIHSEKLRSFTRGSANKIAPHESWTKTQKEKFWNIKKQGKKFDEQVYQMTEFLLTLRPDIPHVRDLLLMTNVFCHVIHMQEAKGDTESTKSIGGKSNLARKSRRGEYGKNKSPTSTRHSYSQQNSNCSINEPSLISLANIIHKHHFLSFFRGDMTQIEGRTKLFQFLLENNAPTVLEHFKAVKLETRMYLVPWFLSVFGVSFEGQLLYRIWDNFLLEEQIYLFKVGITIIKYYETQLKMCTFSQGLDLLKSPPDPSPALFFHILQNQINVTADNYHFYIEKRKQAIIKTKVQSIPLE